MRKQTNGFSLIELMIVIAIIGLLAAIALPRYQANVLKTQLNGALSELAAYRSAFETQISNGGNVSNSQLGYVPSPLTTGDSGTNIGVAYPDGSGHLSVTLGGNAHTLLAGVVLRFVRSSSGTWRCEIDRSAISHWKQGYTPSGCVVL